MTGISENADGQLVMTRADRTTFVFTVDDMATARAIGEACVDHVDTKTPVYLVCKFECPENPAKFNAYIGVSVADHALAQRLARAFDELNAHSMLEIMIVPESRWTDQSFLEDERLGPDGDDYTPEEIHTETELTPHQLVANMLALSKYEKKHPELTKGYHDSGWVWEYVAGDCDDHKKLLKYRARELERVKQSLGAQPSDEVSSDAKRMKQTSE